MQLKLLNVTERYWLYWTESCRRAQSSSQTHQKLAQSTLPPGSKVSGRRQQSWMQKGVKGPERAGARRRRHRVKMLRRHRVGYAIRGAESKLREERNLTASLAVSFFLAESGCGLENRPPKPCWVGPKPTQQLARKRPLAGQSRWQNRPENRAKNTPKMTPKPTQKLPRNLGPTPIQTLPPKRPHNWAPKRSKNDPQQRPQN